MLRKYGTPPYHLVLLHGGPGAIGSLNPLAEELAARYDLGVLEPFQSMRRISALVDELFMQIPDEVDLPVVLVGHSWGAWLALFFAAQHKEWVEKVILIGCPPFEDKYVPLIMQRRMERLAVQEQTDFLQLLSHTHLSDDEFIRLQGLVARTDNYHVKVNENDFAPDQSAYEQVWNEAAAFRSSNGFAGLLLGVSVPIHIIHGEEDPHPLVGVTAPLEQASVHYVLRTLSHCGHSPFLELEAKEEFYDVLNEMIQD